MAFAVCLAVFIILLAIGLTWASGPVQSDDFRNAMRKEDDDA